MTKGHSVAGQPRVPKGSGDKSGEFASKYGGSRGSQKTQAQIKADRLRRSIAATATYKPSTKEKQAIANAAEIRIHKIIGGDRTPDNDAFDVLVKKGRKLHSVEVKAIIDNKNDKITMHSPSRKRKELWAIDNNAVPHTVGVDTRNGGQLYYRSGVGAFRLGKMTKVRNAAHLRQLIGL